MIIMRDEISKNSPSPEQPILRARARGELSCDVAFEEFYSLYISIVRGWAIIGARREDADDICQDVWIIFYRRWCSWRFLPEMEADDARPILSFLYRTFRFSVEGYRRKALRKYELLDDVEAVSVSPVEEQLIRGIELNRCLEVARKLFSPDEIDILLAKLSGISAREIAATLAITEAAVDHRFRNSVARLQKHIRARKTVT
jgi:RNA polymerase sigma factor (sigma-70 family)